MNPFLLAVTWTPADTWIVVIGALAAMACALVGSFLVLRQLSMMGDAISHAVLPGLAGGFLAVLFLKHNGFIAEHLPALHEWATATDPRNPLVMLIGAAIIGVLTALFTQWVHRFGDVDRGAAMGVVFTTLFALGLVMIVTATEDHAVDLDAGCVLYGAVELAPLDMVDWFSPLLPPMPRAAAVIGIVLLINTGIIALLFKELRISSFDPQLSTTLGIPSGAMHYLLMTMVAITTVACFEAIGSILVIAMLIVPAAAAHLLTDRLLPMLIVAMVLGALSALIGHAAAITVPEWLMANDGLANGQLPGAGAGAGVGAMSSAGAIAVVCGLILLVAIFVAPGRGLIPRGFDRVMVNNRIAREDMLAMLYRLQELGVEQDERLGAPEFRDALSLSWLHVALGFRVLTRKGYLTVTNDRARLTDTGQTRAQRIVRAHRLWEAYLAERLHLPLDHVHAPAERLEHITTDAIVQKLAQETGEPETDPHGRKVPPLED